jgi:hypothetical protein
MVSCPFFSVVFCVFCENPLFWLADDADEHSSFYGSQMAQMDTDFYSSQMTQMNTDGFPSFSVASV